MASKTAKTRGRGYVHGRHYTFEPPVEASCAPIGGGQRDRMQFPEGWCLGHDLVQNTFAFQGTPMGEEQVFYFLVAGS